MKPYKKIKKITLEPTDGIVMSYAPEEKECPHIIKKIDVTFYDYDIGTKIIKDKINEIIEVVNIMNRGGRK